MKKYRSPLAPRPWSRFFSYVALLAWTVVVLLPLYWMGITSLKEPIDVFDGPKYLPFVDFTPSNHAWKYVLGGTLGPTIARAYQNTALVALGSSLFTLLLGTMAAYGLTRFNYSPKVGLIASFVGCVLLGVGLLVLKVLALPAMPLLLCAIIPLALYVLIAQTIGRRFRRSLGNNDIAMWMISNRIMPPVVVVIPLYVMYQQVGLLDKPLALIITYTAANLPIAVWLMRDYFSGIPLELEESAQIDGASRFRIFTSIVLPLGLPGIMATFLLVLVFAWNEYLIALFLSKANAQTMPLMVAAMNGTRGAEWWYMSVVIMLMILPVILLSIALERYIQRGLLVGAVKG
jgi:multiple sugar transport system permease protein